MKTFNYTTHSKQVLGDMHTPNTCLLWVGVGRYAYSGQHLSESA